MSLRFSNSESRIQFSILSQGFRFGDSLEEAKIFDRLAEPLMRLVKMRMRSCFQSKFSPDDIVQATFISFMRRHRRKPFDIENAEAMWGLMAKIAMRKCSKEIERYHRAKRDMKKEVRVENQTTSCRQNYFAIASREPDPKKRAESVENVQRLLRSLNTTQREIVVLRLKGFTNKEIGKKLGRTERTIYRMLKDIRFHLVGLKRALAGKRADS